MKLFVVGKASGNPDDWDDDYTLVLAEDETDARILAEASTAELVAEVPMDKPAILARVPEQGWPDSRWDE